MLNVFYGVNTMKKWFIKVSSRISERIFKRASQFLIPNYSHSSCNKWDTLIDNINYHGWFYDPVRNLRWRF